MLFNVLAALAAASLASAVTPASFNPGSDNPLIVSYNGQLALNGAVIAQNAVSTMPQIATQRILNGSSYAVLMVDIDIPTNSPPATTTLLHWMQTGLTPATAATNFNSSNGAMPVFLLQNSSSTPPFAAYLSPSPPARFPLSHMYVQILVDTTGIQQTALDSLQTAAANRSGFNALNTLTAAGLQTKVVAGNFYNVTNPGPISNSTGTASGTSSTSPVQAGAVGLVPQSLMALVVFAGSMLVFVW